MKKVFKVMLITALLAVFAAADLKPVINDLDGEVYILKTGQKDMIPAELEMELSDGDMVITKKDSRVEILIDNEDSMINVLENTQLVISKVERSVKEQKTFLELVSGGIVNILNKAANVVKGMEVKTPNVVAAVKGTQFGVEALEKESTVGVFEGEVAVSGTDVNGADLGAVSVTSEKECRVVQNQRGYKPEKIRNRMSKVYGETHKKALYNMALYARLRKSGELDRVKAARRMMMMEGLKEYVAKNPDWRKTASPEQIARMETMYKNAKAGDAQNYKEVIKKYPFMIEKYKRLQFERLKAQNEMKDRRLPKEAEDRIKRMREMRNPSGPRPGRK